MTEEWIAQLSRRDIAARSFKMLKAGNLVKAALILVWVVVPLRWTRDHLSRLRKQR